MTRSVFRMIIFFQELGRHFFLLLRFFPFFFLFFAFFFFFGTRLLTLRNLRYVATRLGDYSRDTLHGNSKKHRVMARFCMKTVEMCFFKKTYSNFGCCLVTKGGWRRLKIIFVLKISLFKLSENFKFVAHGVLEIFEEVYLGNFFFFFFFTQVQTPITLFQRWIVEYSGGETSTLCRPEVSASPCV